MHRLFGAELIGQTSLETVEQMKLTFVQLKGRRIIYIFLFKLKDKSLLFYILIVTIYSIESSKPTIVTHRPS